MQPQVTNFLGDCGTGQVEPSRRVSPEEFAIHLDLDGARVVLGLFHIRNPNDVVDAVGPERTALAVKALRSRAIPAGASRIVCQLDPLTVGVAILIGGDVTLDLVIDIAERALAHPPIVDGGVVPIDVGIGISPAGHGSAIERLTQAREALAQTNGRLKVCVFGTGVGRRARMAAALAKELPALLAGGAIRAHVQPIVDLRTGRPIMVEALARLDHPHRGLLTPGAFLDAVKQADLGSELRRLMILEVAGHIQRWRRSIPGLRVSVNVQACDLQDPMLIHDVEHAALVSGAGTDWMVVEAVETDLAMSPAIDPVVLGLLERGVGIAVDDFGTGYSSLRQFRDLNADIVKIDGEFVAELRGESANSSVVSLAMMLADARDLMVIAEGVELPVQMRALRRLGCHHAQGYLLGRPTPADTFSP